MALMVNGIMVWDKGEGDPGPPLRIIPLPVVQIVEAAALVVNILEPLDNVGWMVIYSLGWWRSFGQREKCTGGNGFELEHVEGGVAV